MKKSSVAFGIFLVVLLIISGVAAAASPAPGTATVVNRWTFARVVGELGVQNPDGSTTWSGPVSNLVDPNGAVQLRTLAEAVPWLRLSWHADDHTAILESNEWRLVIGENQIVYTKDDDSVPLDGFTVRSINDRLYLSSADPNVWKLLDIDVWYWVERATGPWTIHVQVRVGNPSAPPPTLGGMS